MDKLVQATPRARRAPACAKHVTNIVSIGQHPPPANDDDIPLGRRIAATAPWFVPAVLFVALLWLVAA